MTNIQRALALVKKFKGDGLAETIASLESRLKGADLDATRVLRSEVFGSADLFSAAVTVKLAAAQIDNILHAVGVLQMLSQILLPNEKIVSASLASAGGRADLLTNRRVAEFKFIHWKEGRNSLRNMSTLEDFIRLAERPKAPKRRELYLLGPDHFLRFAKGRSSLRSVFRKNRALVDRLEAIDPRWKTVGDYFASRSSRVSILDLHAWFPRLGDSRGALARIFNESIVSTR